MIFMKFRTALSAFRGLLNYCFALTLLLLIGNLRLGTLHTNTYSVCAAVTVCLSLCAYRCNLLPFSKMKYYIFGGLFCLLLGTSSGSNIAFTCALIFIFSVKNNRFHFSFFIISLLSLFIVYKFGHHIILKILFPNKSIESVTTLHGRMHLWSGYIEIWLKRPFIGWGFAVGERGGKAFDFMYALSAHNGYLSILINTGLIGLSFWLLLFKRLFKSLQRQFIFKSPYAIVVTSAFIIIAINNSSVPIIGSNWGPLATLAFCLLAFWNLWCENAPKGFYQQNNEQPHS